MTSSWELAAVRCRGRGRPAAGLETLWEQIASSFPGFQEGFRHKMHGSTS